MALLYTMIGTLLFATLSFGQSYDIKEATVKFTAKGNPGFLKITGQGATASGTLTKTEDQWQGTLTADLKPIKTGIDLRDRHMHEKYLDTATFPTATLNLTSATWDQSNCQFKGNLTIKGQEKPISGNCDLKSTREGFGGTVEFDFAIGDYPIGVPSYLGVTVADTVRITVEFVATSHLPAE